MSDGMMNPENPEILERLIKDHLDKGGDILKQQLAQWVGNTAWCAGQLLDPVTASRSVAALFWIRLFGTLHDVRKKLRQIQNLSKLENPALIRAADAIDAILDSLSHEDRVYIDYRRQVECHPLQDAYRLTVGKDGSSLRDQRNSPLAGKVEIAVADRICAERERSYNHDAVAVATALAARIHTDLDRAVDAMHEYCGPWFVRM